jgi:hypothetical protein
MKEIEVGIGAYVEMRKGSTIISGLVDGMRLADNGLERISIQGLSNWLWMDSGWEFIADAEEDEDGEV